MNLKSSLLSNLFLSGKGENQQFLAHSLQPSVFGSKSSTGANFFLECSATKY